MADEDDEADENEDEEEREDEEESEDGAAKSTGVGGKKKLIIIILAGALLLVTLIIGGLYFSGFFNSELGVDEPSVEETSIEETSDDEQRLKKTSIEEKSVVEKGKAKKPSIVNGKFYHKFEDLNVNLVSSIRKPRFLRMSMTVAVTKEADILVMETLAPRVMDNVIQYLNGLKPEEFSGSANFQKMHDNVLLRVRAAVAPILVTDALITLALIK